MIDTVIPPARAHSFGVSASRTPASLPCGLAARSVIGAPPGGRPGVLHLLLADRSRPGRTAGARPACEACRSLRAAAGLPGLRPGRPTGACTRAAWD